MKIRLNYLLIITLFAFSCGGDSDTPSTPKTDISSIKISASKSEIEVGQSLTFTVTGNEGSNLTNKSKIYINGSEISGTSYTPIEKGSITVSATYNSLSSNSLIIKIEPKPVTSIKVLSDNSWVDLNHKFTFQVLDSNDEEVTGEAKLFVNNNEIESNTFQPKTYGSFTVVAKLGNFTSEPITIESKQYASTFTRKVLIEDFTGTWCGWCPRVSYGIELVEQKTDNAVITAIHRGNDPYHFGESNIGDLDEGTYPTAKLNRKTTWEYPEPDNVNQVLNFTNLSSNLGLGINSEIIDNKINLEISIGFLKSFENLKYVVYLVEDQLYYNQANYTNYYNAAPNLINFEHNNVLRKVITDLFGDPIPNENMVANGVFKKSFNLVTPLNINNSNSLKFVAFVVDSSGKVINVQKAKINTYKNFD
jgi:hypothetical protein